jgi:hypothetical protein
VLVTSAICKTHIYYCLLIYIPTVICVCFFYWFWQDKTPDEGWLRTKHVVKGKVKVKNNKNSCIVTELYYHV